MIEVKNITKAYASSDFQLKNISFQVQQNEVLGLVGRNGTGKSTILKMLNGLVAYDTGDIYYNKISLQKMSEVQLREMRKKVVYIFQNANLLENKTVFYHLSLAYKLNKQKVDKEKIDEILNFMEISHLKNSICGNLSGGQQQKVGIAMALLQNPQVLLCDEITSALDANSEQEIIKLLNLIKEKMRISIVMVSHNLTLLKNFCDKIIILDDKTIKEIITPTKNMHINENENYYNYVKEFLLND